MKNETWLKECRASAMALHFEISQSDLSSSDVP